MTEANSQSSQLAVEEVIDREGDVWISCGQQRLLVSSKILSVVSPAFNAMLKPGFREGNFERSPDTPLNLSLADDDAEALRTLLLIVHFELDTFQPNWRDELRQHKRLENLVQVADKYCCSHVVEHACNTALDGFDIPSVKLPDLAFIAKASYKLKLSKHFSLCTKYIIKRHHHRDFGGIQSACLREIMRSIQYAILESLCNAVERSFSLLDSRRNETYEIRVQLCPACQYIMNLDEQSAQALKVELGEDQAQLCKCTRKRKTPAQKVVTCDATLRNMKHEHLLRQNNLSPTHKIFTQSPKASATHQMWLSLRAIRAHCCSGGHKCPLVDAAHTMNDLLKAAYDGARGVDLAELEQAEDESARSGW